ncbi:MAG: carbohydrate kinase family protein, partial [Phycisphaeraceae bacterium]|nr:carbohydrate kinase family protein [Phycisphaeraceae bacterium]
VVSLDHPRTPQIVAAAAPHLDVLLVNERELGMMLGQDPVEASADQLEAAAGEALRLGAGSVVAHCPHGAVAVTAQGAVRLGSLRLPEGFVAGATGAGDAFAAGYLLGLHEGASAADCLNRAVCCAAMSLAAPSASDGMQDLQACLALGDAHGYRDF